VIVGLFRHVLFVFPFEDRINTGTSLGPEEKNQIFNPKIITGLTADGGSDHRPLIMGTITGNSFAAGTEGDNGDMDRKAKIIAGFGESTPELTRKIQGGGQAADRSRNRHEITKIQG